MSSKTPVKNKNKRRDLTNRYKQILGVTRDMVVLSSDTYEQTGLEIVELASKMLEVDRF